MNGQLRRIPATEIQRLREDEAFRIELAGLGSVARITQIPDHIYAKLPWYLRLLFRFTVPRSSVRGATPAPASKGEALDLHKSWHGIHWLISRDPWDNGEPPLKYAIFGEEQLGEDLTGYGPPALNPPGRVKEIHNALAALPVAEAMSRFNGPQMEKREIYPGGWVEDASWRHDLGRDYARVRDFYSRAARSGDAVLTWIE